MIFFASMLSLEEFIDNSIEQYSKILLKTRSNTKKCKIDKKIIKNHLNDALRLILSFFMTNLSCFYLFSVKFLIFCSTSVFSDDEIIQQDLNQTVEHL